MTDKRIANFDQLLAQEEAERLNKKKANKEAHQARRENKLTPKQAEQLERRTDGRSQ